MTIGFVGLDHLGVVSSITTAMNGEQIIAYDSRIEIIDSLNRNLIPFYEPGLQDLLLEHSSNIKFTNEPYELKKCNLVFISADMNNGIKQIEELITIVKQNISHNQILIVMSQVPPGFTRSINHPHDVLFYQAEVLIIGNSIEKSLFPDQVIIGCNYPNINLPKSYSDYIQKFNCDVAMIKYESAEMAKISINMMLAAQVSMTNTIAELCEKTESDWSEIKSVCEYDSRIGSYLTPGLGLSGGHIERDLNTLRVLCEKYNTDNSLIETIKWYNIEQKSWVNRILYNNHFLDNNPLIAIWGLSYKSGTDSIKHSPSIFTINYITKFLKKVYDPQVIYKEEDNLTQQDSADLACLNSDILLILTPHPEFFNYSLKALKANMNGNVIIDPYGVFNKQKAIEHGFVHYQLGVKNI